MWTFKALLDEQVFFAFATLYPLLNVWMRYFVDFETPFGRKWFFTMFTLMILQFFMSHFRVNFQTGFVTNASSHLLHLTRSQISECMFLWRFRFLLEENAISQCSYWWSLIFSWTLLNMTFAENNFLFFQLSRSRFGDWTSTSHFTKSLEFFLDKSFTSK